MEILSWKFEMRQFLYQSSRIFTTCVLQITGPWKMQSPTTEILWYLMAMLRILSGQISLKGQASFTGCNLLLPTQYPAIQGRGS